MQPKHLGIYISNNTHKKVVINNIISGEYLPELKYVKGAVFSEITLDRYIDEEIRHGRLVIPSEQNSLKNASVGERKKALLRHLLSSKLPDYLILDNVLDGLDVAFQEQVKQLFEHHSNTTRIIQISTRKQEFFDFIETVFLLENNKLKLLAREETCQENITTFTKQLPRPYRADYQYIQPLIQLNNVSVSYLDKPVIKGINWEVNTGEFWQLLGPNGSGKSTILSLISGDNPKGFLQDMTLFGMKKGSGESVWDIKQHIGFYSAELLRGFRKSETIESMIISGFLDSIGLYKYPTDIQVKLAQDWLEILGMKHIKHKSFQFLSNGHKRLVLIARAMVKQPALLILDEPTNGLDDFDSRIFSELIHKIAKETETAIIYVSHREEAHIRPDYIFELVPGVSGSVGKVVGDNN
ncbi:hypothetical protein MHTCC0001_32030 [Flavobacteriaceae bacterium MHTCC 0001]